MNLEHMSLDLLNEKAKRIQTLITEFDQKHLQVDANGRAFYPNWAIPFVQEMIQKLMLVTQAQNTLEQRQMQQQQQQQQQFLSQQVLQQQQQQSQQSNLASPRRKNSQLKHSHSSSHAQQQPFATSQSAYPQPLNQSFSHSSYIPPSQSPMPSPYPYPYPYPSQSPSSNAVYPQFNTYDVQSNGTTASQWSQASPSTQQHTSSASNSHPSSSPSRSLSHSTNQSFTQLLQQPGLPTLEEVEEQREATDILYVVDMDDNLPFVRDHGTRRHPVLPTRASEQKLKMKYPQPTRAQELAAMYRGGIKVNSSMTRDSFDPKVQQLTRAYQKLQNELERQQIQNKQKGGVNGQTPTIMQQMPARSRSPPTRVVAVKPKKKADKSVTNAIFHHIDSLGSSINQLSSKLDSAIHQNMLNAHDAIEGARPNSSNDMTVEELQYDEQINNGSYRTSHTQPRSTVN